MLPPLTPIGDLRPWVTWFIAPLPHYDPTTHRYAEPASGLRWEAGGLPKEGRRMRMMVALTPEATDSADRSIFRATDIEELGFSLDGWPWVAHCWACVLGEELPAWRAYGPYSEQLPAFLGTIEALDRETAHRLAGHFAALDQVACWNPLNGPCDPEQLMWGQLDEHDSRGWADTRVWRRIHDALVKLGYPEALDPTTIEMMRRPELADPAWIRLRAAAHSMARVIMYPDRLTVGLVAELIDQWAEALRVAG